MTIAGQSTFGHIPAAEMEESPHTPDDAGGIADGRDCKLVQE